MNTTKVIIIGIITALVVSLGVGGLVLHQATQSNQTFGTQVQNDLWYFTGGLRIGTQSNSSLKAVQSNENTANSVTLGALGNTTSSQVLTTQISDPNFKVGDPCIIGGTGSPTASGTYIAYFGAEVSTTTVQSSTVDYVVANETTTIQTVPTSTIKVTCFRN
jgi:hypothetical protein